jgi:hypothetical protein
MRTRVGTSIKGYRNYATRNAIGQGCKSATDLKLQRGPSWQTGIVGIQLLRLHRAV